MKKIRKSEIEYQIQKCKKKREKKIPAIIK